MDKASERYKELIGAAAAALGPDQFWAIANEEGIFPATASKDMGESVRTFCDALDIDWDDAKEFGCRLTVVERVRD